MGIFYGIIFILALAPRAPWSEERTFWSRFIKQIFLPVGSIAFPEIVFADALCSMSKLFKDFGVTIVVMYAKYKDASIVDYHNFAMIFVAILASVPFWYVMQNK